MSETLTSDRRRQLHTRLTELARAKHANSTLQDNLARERVMRTALERANEELGRENTAMHDQLREQAAHEARALDTCAPFVCERGATQVRAQYFAQQNELLQDEVCAPPGIARVMG